MFAITLNFTIKKGNAIIYLNYMLMSVQFTIRITKEIIEHSKNCGVDNNNGEIGRNCAIAFALKDIFPNVLVTNYDIYPFGIDAEKAENFKIAMPGIAQQFIKLFDGFSLMPDLRLLLPEFEFTINIPPLVEGRKCLATPARRKIVNSGNYAKQMDFYA
jgi:hypothetical protein